MARSRYSNNYKQNHGVAGVVYILDNPLLKDGVYKIGCSRRSGAKRAEDLNKSANTGTPGTFRCVFSYDTKDCGKAEEYVFKKLANHRKGKWGQEFFHVELDFAIEVIIKACKEVDAEANLIARQLHSIPRKDTFTISNTANIGNTNNAHAFTKPSKTESFLNHPLVNAVLLVILGLLLFNWILPQDTSKSREQISQSSSSFVDPSATEKPQPKIKVKSKRDRQPTEEIDSNSLPDKPRHQFIGDKEVNNQINEVAPDEVNTEKVESAPEPKAQSTKAELDNLKICLDGRYKALCKHDMLTQEQASNVAEAERSANLKVCLDGKYPTICDHHLLSESETSDVDQAEKRANFKVCIDGKYPTLCKHALLADSEAASVKESELRENLKVCNDGRYPSLCNHSLLTAEEAEKVKANESSH